VGRKKTKGNRSPSGRLKKASTVAGRQQRDYGNEVFQARRALFDSMAIKDGKAVDQAHDGIGRLWALDYLDGHHLDPCLLRDTARKYAELFWIRNADKAPNICDAERVGFSKPSLEDSRADLLFERWIDDLPTEERQALEMVVIDHWHSDKEAPFVDRLVGYELMQRGRIKFARPIEAADRELLASLLRALFVLVDGVTPHRYAA
jgi:hypothetical protein